MTTLTEEDILQMIWEQEPFSEHDVQEHRLDKYIDLLIEKELVVRIPSSSTGTHIYALTGKGEQRIGVDA